MESDRALRQVQVERVGLGRFEISNHRGGRVTVGTGDTTHLTPVELLLGAIGACSGMDVDAVTTRRAEPNEFRVEVSGERLRDTDGNQLDDIRVTFHLRFPDGAEGDAAREVVPRIVQRAHDQLCTVSRTVELGSPVTMTVA